MFRETSVSLTFMHSIPLFRLRNASADIRRSKPRAIVTSVPISAHSNIYSHHVHVVLVYIGYCE